MTATTQTIRECGVMVVECDIPAHLTIAEYRAQRDKRSPRERAHILRPWRLRTSRRSGAF
jgi:hypothetical protein